MGWLERIEVEDGFLDGLDLTFSPHLNVVIGARGTGKTSLLELIRFGLGAPAFTEQAAARATAQVRAVLARGRVTLTIRDDDGASRQISRTIDSDPEPVLQATVLAQNEIEAVGASASGRLHLVDRFLSGDAPRRVDELRRTIASTAKRVDSSALELAEIRARLDSLPMLEAQLATLQAEQESAFERASASEHNRQRVPELQGALQTLSRREQMLSQAAGSIESVMRAVDSARAVDRLTPWPNDLGDDALEPLRPLVSGALDHLDQAAALLRSAQDALTSSSVAEVANRFAVEDEARRLRRELGAVDDEITELSNRIADLNEQIGVLRGLQELADERQNKLGFLRGELAEAYLELAQLRQIRFDERRAIVDRLNAELHPAIRVDLTQSGDISDYEGELLERLRGSGLHAREIATELSATYDPHELIDMIQRDAVLAAAQTTGLTEKRIAAAFSHLRQQSPSGLAASQIEDTAELLLLDNATYKRSSALSIGQRCTAVLPLLLQKQGDLLIIDQPEDHLDNSFVTRTLVASLRQRSDGDQIILASHNANIPVLGDADTVIHMASDGRRGYVVSALPLDAPESVEAVSDVMEGGAEAFRRRAEFYERHDVE